MRQRRRRGGGGEEDEEEGEKLETPCILRPVFLIYCTLKRPNLGKYYIAFCFLLVSAKSSLHYPII